MIGGSVGGRRNHGEGRSPSGAAAAAAGVGGTLRRPRVVPQEARLCALRLSVGASPVVGALRLRGEGRGGCGGCGVGAGVSRSVVSGECARGGESSNVCGCLLRRTRGRPRGRSRALHSVCLSLHPEVSFDSRGRSRVSGSASHGGQVLTCAARLQISSAAAVVVGRVIVGGPVFVDIGNI